MQHRFFLGISPQKYNEQMRYAPAHDCILSGESIPGELLLSRAHFRFDSNANFERLNYIYKLLKKTATFQTLNYHSKLTLDSAHIRKKSKLEIQEKLDEYSAKGYRLTSTNSTNFELAIYI